MGWKLPQALWKQQVFTILRHLNHPLPGLSKPPKAAGVFRKNFYVYKVYKQFGSRSGLTECQAYSVKPGQVPNCLLLSSPIVLVIVLLSISARARANIQFTEKLGHTIFKQKFSQVFVCFFSVFCCCCFFILSKLALPAVMLMQVWAKQVH